MNHYLIYGAGGHASVLQDLIQSLSDGSEVACFFNDSAAVSELKGIPVLPYDPDTYKDHPVIFGIGNSKIRKTLAAKVKHPSAVLIHPKAVVAHDAEIGEGTVVLAGAVIQAGARIGKHVIINANVCVDHDAVVEDYVTTYPGAYLGAACHISEGTLINPNVVIMRFTKTTPFSEITSGSVIV